MTTKNQACEFLSVAGACKASGIGRTTLYRLLAEGNIKARKAGTRTLIEARSLADWAETLPVATFKRPPVQRLPMKLRFEEKMRLAKVARAQRIIAAGGLIN